MLLRRNLAAFNDIYFIYKIIYCVRCSACAPLIIRTCGGVQGRYYIHYRSVAATERAHHTDSVQRPLAPSARGRDSHTIYNNIICSSEKVKEPFNLSFLYVIYCAGTSHKYIRYTTAAVVVGMTYYIIMIKYRVYPYTYTVLYTSRGDQLARDVIT